MEDKDWKQLKRLANKLGVPITEAFWTLEVFDGCGKPIYKKKMRSHSWVRNAYNNLFSNMAAKDGSDSTFGAGKLSVKDTGGTVRYGTRPMVLQYNVSCDATSATVGILTPAAQDTKGIVVGSGTGAESFESYGLETLIAHGNGTGQLAYSASESHSIAYVAETKVLTDTQIRYFNNNSGDDIEVNEIGIVTGIVVGGTGKLVLVSRDKLSSTVTVPDTGQLKVTYEISLTYSS